MQDSLVLDVGSKGSASEDGGVGEGGRAAAALLWSRWGRGHYQLLWPPEEGEEQEKGEGDKRGTTDVEEVAMEVESVTGGEIAEDQGAR